MVLVHSHPAHAHRRQAIRGAWGGRRRLAGGWSTTVFLLGEDPSKGAAGALPTAAVVAAEAHRFGDLVVGSFRDEYHQLRYKHAMALRWAHRHCAHAAHVVKADDDAFVDLYSLEALLGRTFPQGRLPPDTLACHVVPRGTAPQREGKWAVGVEEYPWAEYPAYCAGLAYVTTPATAHRLYLAAAVGVAAPLWVDDVWVTGVVAAALRLRHHQLTMRYSYEPEEMAAWAAKADDPRPPPPFTFVHLDAHDPLAFADAMARLWAKAEAHHQYATLAVRGSGSRTEESPSEDAGVPTVPRTQHLRSANHSSTVDNAFSKSTYSFDETNEFKFR